MPDKYQVEDVIKSELRKMPGFCWSDPIDGGRVHFEGSVDVGRIAERLVTSLRWERRYGE